MGCNQTCKTPIGCTCGKKAAARAKAARAVRDRPVRIDEMPVMQKAAAPNVETGPPRAVVRERSARHGLINRMLWLAGLLTVCWQIVGLVGSLAPEPYSRAVRAAQFDSACGYYGPALTAAAVNSAGPYMIYHVVCANKGYPLPIEIAK